MDPGEGNRKSLLKTSRLTLCSIFCPEWKWDKPLNSSVNRPAPGPWGRGTDPRGLLCLTSVWRSRHGLRRVRHHRCPQAPGVGTQGCLCLLLPGAAALWPQAPAGHPFPTRDLSRVWAHDSPLPLQPALPESGPCPGSPRGAARKPPRHGSGQEVWPRGQESVHVTQPEVSARDAETAASPFGRTERGLVERALATTAAWT